ncbi:hypothetical protein O181_055971 [Austropuccinia psidii MF-1]|uniref:Uncharacterized protein n=1 Tax=Austropuccinia psidii MF-1 TaxID=1389203 RepID=A0A9Q3E5G8_9BASI|nr:hypothetical protein [Austropuccinia psidii MF-1]
MEESIDFSWRRVSLLSFLPLRRSPSLSVALGHPQNQTQSLSHPGAPGRHGSSIGSPTDCSSFYILLSLEPCLESRVFTSVRLRLRLRLGSGKATRAVCYVFRAVCTGCTVPLHTHPSALSATYFPQAQAAPPLASLTSTLPIRNETLLPLVQALTDCKPIQAIARASVGVVPNRARSTLPILQSHLLCLDRLRRMLFALRSPRSFPSHFPSSTSGSSRDPSAPTSSRSSFSKSRPQPANFIKSRFPPCSSRFAKRARQSDAVFYASLYPESLTVSLSPNLNAPLSKSKTGHSMSKVDNFKGSSWRALSQNCDWFPSASSAASTISSNAQSTHSNHLADDCVPKRAQRSFKPLPASRAKCKTTFKPLSKSPSSNAITKPPVSDNKHKKRSSVSSLLAFVNPTQPSRNVASQNVPHRSSSDKVESSTGFPWRKASGTLKSFNTLLHRRRRNTPHETTSASLVSLKINTALTQTFGHNQPKQDSSKLVGESLTSLPHPDTPSSTIISFTQPLNANCATICTAKKVVAPDYNDSSAYFQPARPVKFTREVDSYNLTPKAEQQSFSESSASTHLSTPKAAVFSRSISFPDSSIAVSMDGINIKLTTEEEDLDVQEIMSNFRRIRLNKPSGLAPYSSPKRWLQESDGVSELSFDAVNSDDDTQAFPLPNWPKLPSTCEAPFMRQRPGTESRPLDECLMPVSHSGKSLSRQDPPKYKRLSALIGH